MSENNVCQLHDTMRDADRSQCGKIQDAFGEIRKRLHIAIFLPTVMLILALISVVWQDGKNSREAMAANMKEYHERTIENSVIIQREFQHFNERIQELVRMRNQDAANNQRWRNQHRDSW